MTRTDFLLILYLSVSAIYTLAMARLLQARKEKSYTHGMLIYTPGFIFISVFFAWLFFYFSIYTLVILAIVIGIYITLYTYLMIKAAELMARFSFAQKWRKNFITNRIKKAQTKGRSPIKMQEKGLIPETDKLKEFGFTDQELKELGLLSNEKDK